VSNSFSVDDPAGWPKMSWTSNNRVLGDDVESLATSVGIAQCLVRGAHHTLLSWSAARSVLPKYESARDDVPTVSAVECVENVP
jgi:hypothetical protein